MESIEYIYKHKNSDTAIYLGSGSSINNITEEQWAMISKYDTWAVNNWLYHTFVPKFYHLEIKYRNKNIWKNRMMEKGYLYKNVIFIFQKSEESFFMDMIGTNNKYVYTYNIDRVNSKSNNISEMYKPVSDAGTLTKNLSSSLTLVLELLYRFKYKKIIFFGVDMCNNIYFWTDKPEYGETHCQWNKDHLGNEKGIYHTTIVVKDFVVWFSENMMKKNKGELFVGHKDTVLYPNLKYFDVMKGE